MKKLSAAVAFAAAAMVVWAASAGAVDGTIEINQAKVMAAGGFPFTINASGSYRLTGNLTVSSTTASAIFVTGVAGPVTIDLNGFSITGSGSSTAGHGILGSAAADLIVENGTITQFHGGSGVLTGTNGIVRNVHADSNQNGITVGANSVVVGCTANSNSADGIYCTGAGCNISGNTASSNVSYGIVCGASGCLITSNTILSNGLSGIDAFDSTTGYGNNVLNGNGSPSVFGGTSLGAKNTNLCNGTAC